MLGPTLDRRTSILILERDIDQAAVACTMVEAVGGTSTWTNDLAVALELLDAEPYDTVWASMELDGLALLRRARFRQPEAWRLLTGDGRAWPVVADALRHGDALRFLRRPIDPERMMALLQAMAAATAA